MIFAEGKTELQSAAANLAAKAKFEKAFYNYDTKLMKAAGKVWSEAYNITDINDSTNPLLLIGNGGYKIKSAVTGQSVTLVLNPKHVTNPSGPKTNGVKTIIFRVVGDGTAFGLRFCRNQKLYCEPILALIITIMRQNWFAIQFLVPTKS